MALRTATGVQQGLDASKLARMALLVFLGASVTTMLAHFTGQISGIWVANALLLSFLLKHPRRYWLHILSAGLIANVLADMTQNYGFLSALCMSLSNLAEVMLIAGVLRGFNLDRDFSRPASLLCFYALAAGPAPLLSAVLSSAALHALDGVSFGRSVVNWYSADALGLVIFVPLLMTVRWNAVKRMFARDEILESLFLLGVALVAIAFNFTLREYPFAFLFFPLVVLLTFRRGFAGGALGLALAGSYLFFTIIFDSAAWSMKSHPLREQLMIVQIFVAVMGFSVVLVGAALEERKRLERGLASAITRAEMSREEALVARDAAEKANRAKSMFLANMSHELRTPLNAVIGFAELMNSEMFGPLGDPHYRDYATMIHDAGRHLLELISDILDMSKIESGKFEIHREHAGVGQILEDCVELMRERAETAGITLSASIPGTPLWANVDRRAIKQILFNLLSNAIKFTPTGGRVVAKAVQQGDSVIFSVSDTGIGIAADDISRLGNPFVQLRNNAGTSHHGTGLGLALVRSLVELHHGTFRIDSVENVGTTVTIQISASKADELAA